VQIDASVHRRIVRDFKLFQKIFFVVAALFFAAVSVWLSYKEADWAKVTIIVPVVYGTLSILLSLNIEWFRDYDDIYQNSNQVTKWIATYALSLAVALLLTNGYFGLFPFIFSALCVYSLLIIKRKHFNIVATCLLVTVIIASLPIGLAEWIWGQLSPGEGANLLEIFQEFKSNSSVWSFCSAALYVILSIILVISIGRFSALLTGVTEKEEQDEF